jgi:hypothetical protein
MKRIVQIGLPLLLALLIPAGTLNAQEKKNEQRIKIVVADKSGTKVEIDTIMKDCITADSIKLKDGKIIYIAKHGTVGMVKHVGGKNGQIYVTVTSDEKGDKEITKGIEIISCDSVNENKVCEGGNIIIVKGGNHFVEGKGSKIITLRSDEGDSKGESYIYINEGNESWKDGEKAFNVKVIKDDEGNTVEKTKYVIAKDGMVISIEGNDEAKVKAMIKDIESKMGVTKDDKTKEVVKEETKKPSKK